MCIKIMAIEDDGARPDWEDKLCLTDVLLRGYRNFCQELIIQRCSRPIIRFVKEKCVRNLRQSDLVSKSGEGVENPDCAAGRQVARFNPFTTFGDEITLAK